MGVTTPVAYGRTVGIEPQQGCVIDRANKQPSNYEVKLMLSSSFVCNYFSKLVRLTNCFILGKGDLEPQSRSDYSYHSSFFIKNRGTAELSPETKVFNAAKLIGV